MIAVLYLVATAAVVWVGLGYVWGAVDRMDRRRTRW